MNIFSLLVFLFFKCVFETPAVCSAHLVLPDAPELHVVPGEDGEDPGGGGQPRQADHHQRPLLGPPPQVAEGGGDGPIPGEKKVYSRYNVFTRVSFIS